MKLQIGDKVPDFSTTATFKGPDGTAQERKWTLSEEVKKSPVLLVFYPGDFTPTCTKQLCDYRDNWQSLQRFKVQLIGVSTNDHESHRRFVVEKDFPFALLDDSTKDICRKTGMLLFGLTADRGFVLVDGEMKVRYVFKELLPIFRRKASEVADILQSHMS